MALSGWVIALQVPMDSPLVWGFQASGFVPIVQNTSKRLAVLVVAARLGPSRSIARKGASKMPAPALTVNCRRLSLYMRFLSISLVVDALGEARRIDDGGEDALQGVGLAGSFGPNGIVGASVLIPAGGAEGVVRPIADHALFHVLALR